MRLFCLICLVSVWLIPDSCYCAVQEIPSKSVKKENPDDSSHKVANETLPILVKAMEGGTVSIKDKPTMLDIKNNNETKNKIKPRKGVQVPEYFETNDTLKADKPKSDQSVNNQPNTTHSNTSTNHIVSSTTTTTTTTTTTPSTTTSSTTTTTSTTTAKPKSVKMKPLFTMIKEDGSQKDADSFIESPTTGRDYVLPIVLFILLFPALIFIIRLIYKRGTEFTERQQYHRMYLIDGMYNTR